MRLYQCDWCGAVWGERSAVALVDVTYESGVEVKVFACPDHLPESFYPAADGQPLPEVDPLITDQEARELGIVPDGIMRGDL